MDQYEIYGSVYKIVNTVNTHIYVGSTIYSIEHRFEDHKHKAIQKDTRLRMVMYDIGVEHFRVELIETCKYPHIRELRAREQHYIDLLKPILNTNRAKILREGTPYTKSMAAPRNFKAPTPGIIACALCKVVFKTDHGLKTHMETSKCDKRFQCVKCHKSFKCYSGLKDHNKRRTPCNKHELICDKPILPSVPPKVGSLAWYGQQFRMDVIHTGMLKVQQSTKTQAALQGVNTLLAGGIMQ